MSNHPKLYQMQMEGFKRNFLVYLGKDMETLVIKRKM